MKRILVFLGGAVAIAVAVALATYFPRPTADTSDPPLTAREGRTHSPTYPEKGADHLAAHSKVDPRVIVPRSGRAYSISRTQSLPDDDALSYVQSLLARSEAGDATATYDIYIAVSQCRSTLEAPTLSLLEAYRALGAEQQFKASLARNLEKCESLVSDPALTDVPWLKRAADQGSVEAKIMYAVDPESILGKRADYLSNPERLVAYREEAMNHLQSAASTGSVDAVMALGHAYEAGILTDKSPSKALAYYKAVYSLAPNQDLNQILFRQEKQLSNKEVEYAKKLSERILEECCS